MKRTISVLGYILFGLIVLLPFGTFLSACFGYIFELVSGVAVLIVTALLSLCFVVLSIITKESAESGAFKVLCALLTPLSIINAVFYIFEYSEILVAVCALICICCSVFLTVKYGKPTVLKGITLALSVLMIIPVFSLCFFTLTFGNIGQNTVVRTVESPSGEYYAEVIDSDQGALGGDTFVDIYENKLNLNAVVFRIYKKPERVYIGNWGEAATMDIHWKTDDCIVINSREYVVDG